ncbi:NADH dehydrogenase [ubiquinone] 1 beta subcomplex subunit 9 [Micractinium conductrix]|uniref:NADH dehydrogenase [ubiquinone] 1 beta subcomplex subunit 9 n=1 Tax=Micractinium conductrix TaxID=554055 RepID=A0A2P6V4A9_9CHLO|nr:NADH dehydrogenase [ubiquinone] 1 beta subcomplex subunit 9 [Micractinium conductrix]|eukprot:PSC68932.1 NADH dehydrogenase [ubiquinone] 1 beta subcomplex subunit 9 [Micractinium conductrix]
MATAVQRLRAIHLYRHSLKNMLSWAVRREVFYVEADKLRSDFEQLKRLDDPIQIDRALEKGEARLREHLHPDPYIVPYRPGGSLYARNPPFDPSALCHDNSMADYWTPQYTAFIASGLKKFTCGYFQIAYWWTIALQCIFLLLIAVSFAKPGYFNRYGPNLTCACTTGTILSIMSCIFLMDGSSFWTGAAYKQGTIAFWGFFAVAFINPFMGASICDVAYSERAAAAAAAAPVALGRDVDSGSDDAGKSSQRSAADLMV